MPLPESLHIAGVILEYFKLLLSPQVVGGTVVIFFLIRFRKAIENKLATLATVRAPGGLEASFGAQLEASAESKKVLEVAAPGTEKQGGGLVEQRDAILQRLGNRAHRLSLRQLHDVSP